MSATALPTTVHIAPGTLAGTPDLPGSKYATVRTILAAALASGDSTVFGPARSDDTEVVLVALRALGVAWAWAAPNELRIAGCGGRFLAAGPVTIDAGNAGAVLRLVLGVAATLPDVTFTTPYPESLGQRPNADLLDALRSLGATATAQEPGGRLPIQLRGGRLRGGAVSVSGARGSQYLSALLFLAPLLGDAVDIAVTDGLRSAAFVRLTLATLARAGITVVAAPDLRAFHIPGGQHYQPRDWYIPRDWPSAALWLAAGAVAGGTIAVDGLDGDAEDGAAVLAALRALGADITTGPSSTGDGLIRATAQRSALRGAILDGEPIIDSVPALAAAACFADGTTVFTNVAALRLKESDRIGDLCAELHRAGAQAIPGADTLTIVGQPGGVAGGTTVDAHSDHRLAMALAIVALRARSGLTITGAHHVAKSYPAFWDALASLRPEVHGGE